MKTITSKWSETPLPLETMDMSAYLREEGEDCYLCIYDFPADDRDKVLISREAYDLLKKELA